MDLNTDIEKMNRVGKTTAGRLEKLGLKTFEDLLLFLPFRYEDYSEIKKIDSLQDGDKVNVVGVIDLIQTKKSPRKKMSITEALVNDGTENIKAIWFNQPFISKNLKIGDRVSITGKVEDDFGSLTIKSPNYEKLKLGGNIHTQGLVPIYHSTSNISQKQIRFLINSVLKYSSLLKDIIPPKTTKELGFISLEEAIKKIHFPESEEDIKRAQERLAFEELFIIQIRSLLLKQKLQNKKAPQISYQDKETKDFVASLPFELTDSQRKAAWEIINDIDKEAPMSRLLEGDVGSGKTVVASLAVLNTVLNQRQAAMMSPTEILARQHYKTISELFSGRKINIALLSSGQYLFNGEKISKKKMIEKALAGEANLLIGTHSLIQKDIGYKNLSLVVVDEQHRFGVEQRHELLEKSGLGAKSSPHFLSMTATPIPRSLALSIYGDLDISIIKEMPKNRLPVVTKIVNEKSREKLYQFCRQEIKKGRQIFVVCPLIDISDKSGLKSVKQETEKLQKNIFPEFEIAGLHGKLKSREKEEIMESFKKNKINILVSTSVIEVGIDIPNASIMIIEDSERFGLSQLHQFRGRIGRGEYQSYCFLATESKSEKSLQRLEAMTKYNNGFELSKIDLEMRGPGEFYGTSQKGFPELKVATIFDIKLINLAREKATEIIKEDPELKKNPLLAGRLEEFEKNIHLE